MNERIEQLAEQCWVHTKVPLFGAKSPHWEFDRHKFAELIVRECANLAKTKSDSIVERAMKYAEDADEETSAKATAWQFLVFEQEIKKHFGVEE